jgi:hypothetical protein
MRAKLTGISKAASLAVGRGNSLRESSYCIRAFSFFPLAEKDEIAAAIANLPKEKYDLAIKLINKSKNPMQTLQINHTIPRAITRDVWFLRESVMGFNMDKYPENLIPVINHVGSHPRFNEFVLDRMTAVVGKKYMSAFTEFKKTGRLSEEIRQAIRKDVLEELKNLNNRLMTEDGLLYPDGNYVVLGELKGKIP